MKVLIEQAKDLDPGRVFRICDRLAEMEDKLRYVLSVRTLIEMSLIRASRIATTATIEELMKAVKGMRSGEADSRPLQNKDGSSITSGQETASPLAKDKTPKWAGGGLPPMPEEPAQSNNSPMDRQAMLDDPKLNEILDAIPGATIMDIK